jgi:hypothetical protein
MERVSLAAMADLVFPLQYLVLEFIILAAVAVE